MPPHALAASFSPGDRWLLVDIETLADIKVGEHATVLGDLWHGVRRAPIPLTTADLCAALALSSQVVSLGIRSESDPAIQLLIEDGERVLR